jgi:hypothetical protein
LRIEEEEEGWASKCKVMRSSNFTQALNVTNHCLKRCQQHEDGKEMPRSEKDDRMKLKRIWGKALEVTGDARTVRLP